MQSIIRNFKTKNARELTKDHVLTSAYVKIFRTVTRNAVNKCLKEKRLFLTSLKQTCNEYLYLNINKCKLAFLLQKPSSDF